MELVCSKCKAKKPEEEFNLNRSWTRGRAYWCRSCHKEYNLKFSRDHREQYSKYGKETGLKNKQLCFSHYGNICKICGSSNYPVIDHIEGELNSNRYRTGRFFYAWLVKNNFPAGFRTLCNRCNILDGVLRNFPLLNLKGIDNLLEKLKIA